MRDGLAVTFPLNQEFVAPSITYLTRVGPADG